MVSQAGFGLNVVNIGDSIVVELYFMTKCEPWPDLASDRSSSDDVIYGRAGSICGRSTVRGAPTRVFTDTVMSPLLEWVWLPMFFGGLSLGCGSRWYSSGFVIEKEKFGVVSLFAVMMWETSLGCQGRENMLFQRPVRAILRLS